MKKSTLPPNLLGISGAAKLLKWTPQRFFYQVKFGDCPDYFIIDGRKFFDKAVLLAWKPKDKRCQKRK